jgi:iduronate 2-sulfatase
MNPRLRFRLLTCALLLGAGLSFSAETSPKKLNVLFIASDDWRPEIACYGAKGMITPNVDKLASSAVRFDRAYCQYPLCNPSRTSLLTGRYPTTTGAMNNTVAFRDEHPDWVSLPQCFREQGYSVARTGKIYHGGIDDTKAWDEVVEGGGKGKAAASSAPKGPDPDRGKKKQDRSKSDRAVLLDDDEDHGDYQVGANGIALLEKHAKAEKPFFIAVGFQKPHSPPTAPKRFFDMHDPSKIELPPDFKPRPATPEGMPAACLPLQNGDLFVNRDATEQAAKEMIQAYRASASYTDWNIGRVLDALDRLGLADHTLVVFFGDHGYHLGEKGKWSKHGSLFEVATRVPLVVRLPKATGNGQMSPRTVELLDVYPTLVELCGLKPPAGLEGNSFAALLQDPKAAWAHPAFSVTQRDVLGKSVRVEGWRYTEWDDGKAGAVLFDESSDPHEMKNLVNDPQHAATVEKLKSFLRGNWSTVGAK